MSDFLKRLASILHWAGFSIGIVAGLGVGSVWICLWIWGSQFLGVLEILAGEELPIEVKVGIEAFIEGRLFLLISILGLVGLPLVFNGAGWVLRYLLTSQKHFFPWRTTEEEKQG